mgnify:CR=1 FL=1
MKTQELIFNLVYLAILSGTGFYLIRTMEKMISKMDTSLKSLNETIEKLGTMMGPKVVPLARKDGA